MKCKELSKHMGDYVNKTLSSDLASDIESHLSACPKCVKLVRELQSTSLMVRSLSRLSAPAGFAENVRSRIAIQSESKPICTSWELIMQWLHGLRQSLRIPVFGQARVPRLVVVSLLLCLVVVGSMLVVNQVRYSSETVIDWAYIETCRDQHASFASANPLADNAAILLRERAHDLGGKM
ncbi:MAG: zf-HC2 domain-containing protein [Armatimonadetes bacterium]|nr:zf-HC2 domain-containing protein [Armatimonadota bacterium]